MCYKISYYGFKVALAVNELLYLHECILKN